MLFRILINPFIHNLSMFKSKIYTWLKKKSEIDDGYEKYLKWFESEDKK